MTTSAMKYIVLFPILLTGCTANPVTVTKENSADFDTWELCTLLHNPQSLYSDWISEEEENGVISTELENRGFTSKEDCSIESIAKAKCVSLGFKEGTSDYAKCHLDVELHVKEMKQMKKSALETGGASGSAVILVPNYPQSRPPPTFEPVWKP